ncbi:hypothetical protein [Sphingomonas sanxanigenens]|uniref:Uncharacterized protein n=1 Tax=Sphingomonas sanxanigenens DSM 19645 = NX02 TaxID=1123269 RepID=W0A6C9_9SPHN|nr:hypothetical protein [Sphingomonas sanxanigenens]AHE52017.1 hypothetical protein NX02_01255 [Sphingomonas sanxanigenens DSM 19645 = NX02]
MKAHDPSCRARSPAGAVAFNAAATTPPPVRSARIFENPGTAPAASGKTILDTTTDPSREDGLPSVNRHASV